MHIANAMNDNSIGTCERLARATVLRLHEHRHINPRAPPYEVSPARHPRAKWRAGRRSAERARREDCGVVFSSARLKASVCSRFLSPVVDRVQPCAAAGSRPQAKRQCLGQDHAVELCGFFGGGLGRRFVGHGKGLSSIDTPFARRTACSCGDVISAYGMAGHRALTSPFANEAYAVRPSRLKLRAWVHACAITNRFCGSLAIAVLSVLARRRASRRAVGRPAARHRRRPSRSPSRRTRSSSDAPGHGIRGSEARAPTRSGR